MGRLIMILGIILLVVGTIGVIVGMIGVPLQFTSTIIQAVTPTAEELCEPGETLDEVRGAEEYTALEGYRRSVRYFCVNDAGERREVTGSFVTGMLADAFSGVGTLLIPLLASCLCTVGIIFTVVGFLFSRRRQLATASSFDFPAAQTYIVQTQTPQTPQPRTPPASTPPAVGGTALSDRLRQLDNARTSGLITEEEYQRMRREALDSFD
jgi:hypothetical protein